MLENDVFFLQSNFSIFDADVPQILTAVSGVDADDVPSVLCVEFVSASYGHRDRGGCRRRGSWRRRRRHWCRGRRGERSRRGNGRWRRRGCSEFLASQPRSNDEHGDSHGNEQNDGPAGDVFLPALTPIHPDVGPRLGSGNSHPPRALRQPREVASFWAGYAKPSWIGGTAQVQATMSTWMSPTRMLTGLRLVDTIPPTSR